MAAADDEPSPEIVDIYEICSALRTAGIGFTHMHSSTGIESLHVMAADGSYMAVGLNETDADGICDCLQRGWVPNIEQLLATLQRFLQRHGTPTEEF
jgi:hypothetical protein